MSRRKRPTSGLRVTNPQASRVPRALGNFSTDTAVPKITPKVLPRSRQITEGESVTITNPSETRRVDR